MNPWSGLIAHVGRETVDGLRTLEGLEWDRLPLPLDAAGESAAVLGRIETIDRRPSGEVHATGTVDLPPGTYAVAVSVASTGAQVLEAEPLRVSGRLLGAAVFPSDPTAAAWPDALIVVTDAPVTIGGTP